MTSSESTEGLWTAGRKRAAEILGTGRISDQAKSGRELAAIFRDLDRRREVETGDDSDDDRTLARKLADQMNETEDLLGPA